MVLEELLREEKDAGKAEGKAEFILDILSELGTVSEDMQKAIHAITNLDILQTLFQEALHADSLEQFAQVLQNYQK